MINEIKYYIYKYYKYLIVLVLIVIILLLFIPKKENREQTDIIINDDILIEEPMIEEEIKNKTIKIDIKGAVKNPGVYELDVESRVNDAIKISGGLNKNADTTILNLSKTLEDQDVIIIYTKEEIDEMKQGSTTVKIVEKECVCPEIENVACIEKPITNNESNKENINQIDDSEQNKISLNKATKEQLETLPGIGGSKADAIIKYREENNGFNTIDELKNISGIGDKTFEKLKNLITT